MLFCHVTSKVRGDPHQTLLREKGGRGFPYLVFMDQDGEVLARQRDRTVVGFEKTRDACRDYLKLVVKSKAGDESVAADLLIARIEMGSIGFAEAKEAEAGLGKIPAEKRARIFDIMLDLEVSDAIAKVRTRAQSIELGKRFGAMWGEGRVPKGGVAPSFYSLIMDAAYADGDATAYERALKMYEKVAPQGRGRNRTLDRLRRRLEELKDRRPV